MTPGFSAGTVLCLSLGDGQNGDTTRVRWETTGTSCRPSVRFCAIYYVTTAHSFPCLHCLLSFLISTTPPFAACFPFPLCEKPLIISGDVLHAVELYLRLFRRQWQ